MASVQFATIEEFYEYIGKLPPDGRDDLALNAALKRMSARIARATRLARVVYLDTGIPSTSRIADAFSRATAAELAASGAVDEAGLVDDEILAGVGSEWSSISLIGVQFSRNGTGSNSGSASPAQAAAQLSEDARNELINAGIYTTRVSH